MDGLNIVDGEEILLGPQHFQLNVIVFEARHLVASKIHSKVVISSGAHHKTIRPKVSKSDAPIYNDFCKFQFYKPLKEVLEEILNIRLYRVSAFKRDKLLGSFSVELATVWMQPNHQFYHKWAALVDQNSVDSGVKGYLKCDISLLAKGSMTRNAELDAGDKVQDHLLVPYGEIKDRQKAKFIFSIFRADNFDEVFLKFPSRKRHPYVKITYCGLNGKTSLAKSMEASWNEELAFPDMIPALCQNVHVELFDPASQNPKIPLGVANLDLRKMGRPGERGFLPTYGPAFVYLYHRYWKAKNEGDCYYEELPLTYFCRLLMALRTEMVDYGSTIEKKKVKRLKIKPKKIPPLNEKRYFKYTEVILFAVIYDVNIFDASGRENKISIRMNIGPREPCDHITCLPGETERICILKAEKENPEESNETDSTGNTPTKKKKSVSFRDTQDNVDLEKKNKRRKKRRKLKTKRLHHREMDEMDEEKLKLESEMSTRSLQDCTRQNPKEVTSTISKSASTDCWEGRKIRTTQPEVKTDEWNSFKGLGDWPEDFRGTKAEEMYWERKKNQGSCILPPSKKLGSKGESIEKITNWVTNLKRRQKVSSSDVETQSLVHYMPEVYRFSPESSNDSDDYSIDSQEVKVLYLTEPTANSSSASKETRTRIMPEEYTDEDQHEVWSMQTRKKNCVYLARSKECGVHVKKERNTPKGLIYLRELTDWPDTFSCGRSRSGYTSSGSSRTRSKKCEKKKNKKYKKKGRKETTPTCSSLRESKGYQTIKELGTWPECWRSRSNSSKRERSTSQSSVRIQGKDKECICDCKCKARRRSPRKPCSKLLIKKVILPEDPHDSILAEKNLRKWYSGESEVPCPPPKPPCSRSPSPPKLPCAPRGRSPPCTPSGRSPPRSPKERSPICTPKGRSPPRSPKERSPPRTPRERSPPCTPRGRSPLRTPMGGSPPLPPLPPPSPRSSSSRSTNRDRSKQRQHNHSASDSCRSRSPQEEKSKRKEKKKNIKSPRDWKSLRELQQWPTHWRSRNKKKSTSSKSSRKKTDQCKKNSGRPSKCSKCSASSKSKFIQTKKKHKYRSPREWKSLKELEKWPTKWRKRKKKRVSKSSRSSEFCPICGMPTVFCEQTVAAQSETSRNRFDEALVAPLATKLTGEEPARNLSTVENSNKQNLSIGKKKIRDPSAEAKIPDQTKTESTKTRQQASPRDWKSLRELEKWPTKWKTLKKPHSPEPRSVEDEIHSVYWQAERGQMQCKGSPPPRKETTLPKLRFPDDILDSLGLRTTKDKKRKKGSCGVISTRKPQVRSQSKESLLDQCFNKPRERHCSESKINESFCSSSEKMKSATKGRILLSPRDWKSLRELERWPTKWRRRRKRAKSGTSVGTQTSESCFSSMSGRSSEARGRKSVQWDVKVVEKNEWKPGRDLKKFERTLWNQPSKRHTRIPSESMKEPEKFQKKFMDQNACFLQQELPNVMDNTDPARHRNIIRKDSFTTGFAFTCTENPLSRHHVYNLISSRNSPATLDKIRLKRKSSGMEWKPLKRLQHWPTEWRRRKKKTKKRDSEEKMLQKLSLKDLFVEETHPHLYGYHRVRRYVPVYVQSGGERYHYGTDTSHDTSSSLPSGSSTRRRCERRRFCFLKSPREWKSVRLFEEWRAWLMGRRKCSTDTTCSTQSVRDSKFMRELQDWPREFCSRRSSPSSTFGEESSDSPTKRCCKSNRHECCEFKERLRRNQDERTPLQMMKDCIRIQDLRKRNRHCTCGAEKKTVGTSSDTKDDYTDTKDIYSKAQGNYPDNRNSYSEIKEDYFEEGPIEIRKSNWVEEFIPETADYSNSRNTGTQDTGETEDTNRGNSEFNESFTQTSSNHSICKCVPNKKKKKRFCCKKKKKKKEKEVCPDFCDQCSKKCVKLAKKRKKKSKRTSTTGLSDDHTCCEEENDTQHECERKKKKRMCCKKEEKKREKEEKKKAKKEKKRKKKLKKCTLMELPEEDSGDHATTKKWEIKCKKGDPYKRWVVSSDYAESNVQETKKKSRCKRKKEERAKKSRASSKVSDEGIGSACTSAQCPRKCKPRKKRECCVYSARNTTDRNVQVYFSFINDPGLSGMKDFELVRPLENESDDYKEGTEVKVLQVTLSQSTLEKDNEKKFGKKGKKQEEYPEDEPQLGKDSRKEKKVRKRDRSKKKVTEKKKRSVTSTDETDEEEDFIYREEMKKRRQRRKRKRCSRSKEKKKKEVPPVCCSTVQHARVYNGCNAIAQQKLKVKDCVAYAAFGGNYPCLHVNGEWPNALRRMYRVNIVQHYIRKLTVDLNCVRHSIQSGNIVVASGKIKQIYKGLPEDCREILCQTGKVEREDTNLYRERKRYFHLEVRKMIEYAEEASKRKVLDSEEEMRRISRYLTAMKQYAHDPEDSFPDTEIWLLKDGRIAGQHRLRTRKIVYSKQERECGRSTGKVQSIVMRGKEGKIIAKLDMFMWFGSGKNFLDCRNMLPPGFSELNHVCPGTTISKIPLVLRYTEVHHFECRVYVFQAKIFITSNSEGFADPYVRISLLGQNKESHVLKDTLNPKWDETILLPDVAIPGTDKWIRDNSITVLVEVIDYDEVSRNKVIGRAFVRPVVKLKEEKYGPPKFPPKLEWEELRNDFGETGKILITSELLELCEGPTNQIVPSKPKKMSIPKEIRPNTVTHRLEVFFWGVRELRKRTSQNSKVFVTLECGGKHVSSMLIRKMRKFPNFPGQVQILDFEIPDEHEYKPPLILKMFRTSPIALQIECYIGNCIVPSVKTFYCRNFDQVEYSVTEQTCFQIQSEGDKLEDKEEKVKCKDVELTCAEPEMEQKMKTKCSGIWEYLDFLFKRAISKDICLEDLAREDELLLVPSQVPICDEEMDWWHKYHLSKDFLRRKNCLNVIEIYKQELELQPEFNQFSDFIHTFEIFSRKVKCKSEKDSFEGKVKAVVRLYKWPVEKQEVESAPCLDVDKGLLNHFPKNGTVHYIVRVYVISGRHFTPKVRRQRIHPYVVVQLGKRKINDKKNYVKQQSNPIFGKCYELPGTFPKEHLLRVKVMNHFGDDLVGETVIDLENRFYTRHHASCGLSKVFITTGHNAWRDVKKPTELLKEVCKESNLPEPIYTSESVQIGSYEFRSERPLSEKYKVENQALDALNKWHEIPVRGFHLVPEHLETRALYHPDMPGIEQGKLEMWVDIFPATADVPPQVDVRPREPQEMELRAIIWNVQDVVVMNKTMLFNEKLSDIYLTGRMEAMEESRQQTDVQNRYLNRKGSVNWRFIFQFKYNPTEQKLVVYKESKKEKQEVKVPCKLHLQMWYNEFFHDEFIGTLTLELEEMPYGAEKPTKCTLDLLNPDSPRLNLFKVKRTRGWWPFRKVCDAESTMYSLTGKVDLELELLTRDEASIDPVGKARDGPKALPTPQESTLPRYQNPFLKYLFCGIHVKYLVIALIAALIILFIAVGVYSYPAFLVKKWVGA